MRVDSLDYGEELVEGSYNLNEDSIVHRSVEVTLKFVWYDKTTINVQYNYCVVINFVCLILFLVRVKHAEICGTKYCKGYMVPCYIDDDMPVFGQIMDMIILPTSKCLFVLKPFVSSTFNAHYHAFEVSPVQEVLLYYQHELVDFHPLHISKSSLCPTPLFVRCKYSLCV